MRRLIAFVGVLAVVYGGYWFVGSSAVEKGTAQALTQMQADGWDVSYSDLSTIGFPSRFDTTVTDPALTDPTGTYSWAAPFLQVFALSYQPNKVIVIAPPTQSLTTPAGKVDWDATGLRASASVGVSSDMPLTSVIVESGAGSIIAENGGTLAYGKLILGLKPTDTPLTYAAYADLEQITLPDELMTAIDPNRALPPQMDLIRLNGTVALTRALDRGLATGAAPQPTAISVSDARLVWGAMVLSAAGDLTVDAFGVPTGRITMTAQHWQDMITHATSAGLITPEVAKTWTNMGNMLAAGQPDLKMPIDFANGQMMFGPFPLGPAPRLIYRQ